MSPSTSLPCSMKPKGASKPISLITPCATYLSFFHKGSPISSGKLYSASVHTYTAHHERSKLAPVLAKVSSSLFNQTPIWASINGSIRFTLLKLYCRDYQRGSCWSSSKCTKHTGPGMSLRNAAWDLCDRMLNNDSVSPKEPVI
jgi:hypothetical protein